ILNVGSGQVLLLDADEATLSGQVFLGAGGQLLSLNGISLAVGAALTASGNSSVIGPFINKGIVIGPSTTGQLLTFDDPVTGPGIFSGNIRFANGVSVVGSAPV